MTASVVLVGGPDTGKTNYIPRLWAQLEAAKGALHAAEQPKDLSFVLQIADHQSEGHFAPRTDLDETRRNFEVVVACEKGGRTTNICVPDIKGELWRKAVLEGELPVELMQELRRSDGAIIFLRLNSELHVNPLDWVRSKKLLQGLGDVAKPGLPTQVMLCELVRFLENTLTKRASGLPPRLSVVVAAWDMADPEMKKAGPMGYLRRHLPMFAGRLQDTSRLEMKVFGLSIFGGDLEGDDEFREQLLQSGPDGHGWILVEDDAGKWQQNPDLTLPVAWVVDN